jgi:hypothetical protein
MGRVATLAACAAAAALAARGAAADGHTSLPTIFEIAADNKVRYKDAALKMPRFAATCA